jgi:DNA polymerase I-like protein with 3'-5' exonuclease and polymerase domains
MEYAKQAGCKIAYNSETNKPSSDKKARKKWGRTSEELKAQFLLLDEIKKQTTLKNNFAKDSLLDPILNPEGRMFFNLMPTGTAEGRFSSAGRREGIDMNIQNQPPVIRKIFVTDEPGDAWLNLDVCQGENMITAYLARDFERLERLSDPNYSEHADIASQFFNCHVEKHGENSHLYKAGKVVNHGRNYGLGIRKTQEDLSVEGLNISEADVRELFAIWEKRNARTAAWQRETIAIAERQGFLENPFGRRRWFQSRDFATKALAFLPASTLADVVIRMMIAHYPVRFAR